MKILYIIGELGKGGQEQQLQYLLENIPKRQYQLSLIVWNYSNNFKDTVKEIENWGVKIYLYDQNKSSLNKLIKLSKLVKVNKIDIIHSFTFSKNFYSYIASFFSNCASLGALRSSFNFQAKYDNIIVLIINSIFPKIIISNNASGLEELKCKIPRFIKKKYYIISNKLDLNKFYLAEFPRFNQTNSISIGRLSHEKRIDIVIDVIKKVADSGLNVKHIHIGDGNLIEQLKNKVENLGISKIFKFIGEKSNITELIGNSHFLLHTSDYEGMPNVIMESMACGRAVISTDCGDSKHLVESGIHGYIVPKGNTVLLVEKYKLLAENTELCIKLGNNARYKASREFGVEKLIEETINVYREIIEL